MRNDISWHGSSIRRDDVDTDEEVSMEDDAA